MKKLLLALESMLWFGLLTGLILCVWRGVVGLKISVTCFILIASIYLIEAVYKRAGEQND